MSDVKLETTEERRAKLKVQLENGVCASGELLAVLRDFDKLASHTRTQEAMTEPSAEKIAEEVVRAWHEAAADAMTSGPHPRPVLTDTLVSLIAAAVTAERTAADERVAEARKAATEISRIIDVIENRCMAVDGPVTPTLQEATEDELARIWQNCQTIRALSPQTDAGATTPDEAAAVKFYVENPSAALFDWRRRVADTPEETDAGGGRDSPVYYGTANVAASGDGGGPAWRDQYGILLIPQPPPPATPEGPGTVEGKPPEIPAAGYAASQGAVDRDETLLTGAAGGPTNSEPTLEEWQVAHKLYLKRRDDNFDKTWIAEALMQARLAAAPAPAPQGKGEAIDLKGGSDG